MQSNQDHVDFKCFRVLRSLRFYKPDLWKKPNIPLDKMCFYIRTQFPQGIQACSQELCSHRNKCVFHMTFCSIYEQVCRARFTYTTVLCVQEEAIETQCSYNCPRFIASNFYVLPARPILNYQIDLESRNTTAMTSNNSRANAVRPQ